jgi:ectoine hydroxylase
MQILGSSVYVHQFKINAKLPFSREVAPWHQEFKLWDESDGMPTPRALIAAVFLDEVTEFNGPLVFMAGSHQEGLIDRPLHGGPFGPALAGLRYYLDSQTAARLAKRYPLVAPKGSPGSVVLFHSTTVHGSVPSMSPSSRDLVLIAFNSVENTLPAREATATQVFRQPRL